MMKLKNEWNVQNLKTIIYLQDFIRIVYFISIENK